MFVSYFGGNPYDDLRPESRGVRQELAKVVVIRALDLVFDDDSAAEAIRKGWVGSGDPKRWREICPKHSKSFVVVGDGNDRSWAEPTMALEFVPKTTPTTLRVGDDLRVCVMKKGSPPPGFSVGVVHAGDTRGVQRITNAQGRIVVHLDHPGLWLLRGTELRKPSTDEADWGSDFTTLTIEVRP